MHEDAEAHRQLSGDELLQMLEALANPHRMRIIAKLAGKRTYVSQLAREMEMSRPLLYMHLKRMENAGLVASKLELSEDGKAMNYYELAPFALNLTPDLIAEASKTLTVKKQDASDRGKKKGE